ncbi:hypothetical protein HK096_007970 [Nowakowskiella sp. JEL0078]|nr:hypothetical protein HK096_007970 [Nowakowskiella sp. JEL0078]
MSKKAEGIVKTAMLATNIRRKNVKKGLQFTVMCVGSSGLGKSTFVNTLCESNVFAEKDFTGEKLSVEKTVEIKPVTVEMEEDGIKLSLTIIDTPGFGDNINNEARHARVFLREMDIEFMKRLGPRVNVLPVVAKSDTLTPPELAAFKKRINEDIAHYSIPIYNFPIDEEEDDDETIEENNELRELLPFAIVGSEEEVVISGRRVRCRQYPWGVVEVDNSRHCDFSKLRYMLLSSHLSELKEITHDILYEQYRTEKLSKEGAADDDDEDDEEDE